MRTDQERKDSRRRIGALIHKEFYQIIRDPSSIIICVVLPLILMFLYGSAVSLTIDHLKIGLVLEDTSPLARSFAESLTSSPYFDVTVARDRRDLTEPLLRGSIRGFVIVPSYFSDFAFRGDTAPIQVVADGSETNTANFVHNYVAGAWLNWLNIQKIAQGLPSPPPAVGIQSRFWYNEQLESRYFLIPGSLALTMTLIGTLLTALVVSREWERGTMEALLSTPIHMLEMLVSKLIAYFMLGMISMLISFSIAVFFYQVPFRGSFLVLMFIAAIFLLSALGMGLFISSWARSQFVASQMAMMTAYMPAFMLSGFIFEIASMPAWIRFVTYFVPARYFVSSLQTLFLVGNVWPLLIFNLVPMAAVGALFFYLTLRNTRKDLE